MYSKLINFNIKFENFSIKILTNQSIFEMIDYQSATLQNFGRSKFLNKYDTNFTKELVLLHSVIDGKMNKTWKLAPLFNMGNRGNEKDKKLTNSVQKMNWNYNIEGSRNKPTKVIVFDCNKINKYKKGQCRTNINAN